jgi:hypothetical protein
MYNTAMKNGKLKEEDVVKISITAKRAGEEFNDSVALLSDAEIIKKKRMRSN